ncbi:MAG TPA: hypothetical protein VGW38_01080, partial [Chloroflexota bacterium]|nr:hypothetical protein [Chloroflexota bacterium]
MWREPLLRGDDDRPRFPTKRFWTSSDLSPISDRQLEAFTQLDRELVLQESGVLILCGSIYAKRLERTGIDLSLYGEWHLWRGGQVATGTIYSFGHLTTGIAVAAQQAFWLNLTSGEMSSAESALRILEQNPSIDRRRYH